MDMEGYTDVRISKIHTVLARWELPFTGEYCVFIELRRSRAAPLCMRDAAKLTRPGEMQQQCERHTLYTMLVN